MSFCNDAKLSQIVNINAKLLLSNAYSISETCVPCAS